MHLKVFLTLKNPKNSLFWANIQKKNQKTPKTQKKTKKTQKKNQKTQKNPLGWFKKKKTGFFQPCLAAGGVRAEVAGKADAAVDGVLVQLELVAAGGGEGAGVAVEAHALVRHQPVHRYGRY
jgi:hypothetical protein